MGRSILRWSPRVLGIAIVLGLGMFALEPVAGGPRTGAWSGHVAQLAPAVIGAAALAVAWRRERAGAVIYLVLAGAYAISVGARHLAWIPAVSGPLALVGVLFLASGLVRAHRS